MKTKLPRKPNPAIICGTDFTPAASRAADVAAALARCLEAPLRLVHARVIRAFPPLDDELHAEAERLRLLDTEVKESMLDGNGVADEELVKLAKPRSCQLLVVSSLGKRAPARWLLGSVSERTAQRASVPTLVVRNAGPLLEWTSGKRPLRVFVAFTPTRTAEAALRWVKELRLIGPCTVIVGHVFHPQEQRNRLGDTEFIPLVGSPPEMQQILERDLVHRVAKLLGTDDFEIRVEAGWGRPDAPLAEMAMEESADLMVAGSHQYHGFERLWNMSISRGLLYEATMNVAVVPLTAMKLKPAPAAPPVEKVLVTTDFSDLANRAISHAYSLLGGGGSVHLVHVIHPNGLPKGEYLRGSANKAFRERHGRYVKSLEKRLEARIPADAALYGIATDVEVVEHRNAALGICQAAERLDADAICLATHGHTGLASTVLGSVATALLRRSKRPLYLIRVVND